ncbi:Lsorbosone dehydrogenase [Bradyrhizobium sp.]|nr:Lsorbosone dehydrogenase [Bradyrhizobium sp.]
MDGMSASEKFVLDKATRIVATATRSRYDQVSILLHWSTAGGFIGEDGKTRGRPVGVTVDTKRGALIVADDLSNTIWRVTVATGQQSNSR